MYFIKISLLLLAFCQQGHPSSSQDLERQFDILASALQYIAKNAVKSNCVNNGEIALSALANGHQTPHGEDGFSPEQEKVIKTIMIQSLSVLKDTLKPEDLTRDYLLKVYTPRDDAHYNRNVEYILTLAQQTLNEIPQDLFERFRYVGQTLPVFEDKHRFSIGMCPRQAFYNMLKNPLHADESREMLLEHVYFSLFSLAGAKSTSREMNVDYIREHYPDLLKMVEEVPGFDPSFKRLSNEFGIVFQYNDSKMIHPLKDHHTTLVLGGGQFRKTSREAHPAPHEYSINLFSTYSVDERLRDPGHDPDLIADINSIEQMMVLPSKRFDTIITEGIPAFDYYNPFFFENMRRLLRDEGVLTLENMGYMEYEPFFIKDRAAYFRAQGFSMQLSDEKDRRGEPKYLHLKKLEEFH